MRRLILVCASTAMLTGCLPTTPGCNAPSTPQASSLTATMPDGHLVYICSTQPRAYVTAAGQTSWSVDHYVSETACPSTPIE